MLPIGHVPTQIYVNKTYIPHYNFAIIYIYFLEYIFFYIFFTFGQVVMASVLVLSTIDRGFEPRSGKPKDYVFCSCDFCTEYIISCLNLCLQFTGSVQVVYR